MNQEQGQAPTEEEEQAELIRLGGSSPRIELQAGEPVTFIEATHSTKDLLERAQIWNIGKKAVVGIRVGWRIRRPNEPAETEMGEWVTFKAAVPAGATAEVPAQNISGAPLKTVGTLVKLYIAEVRFQDNTIWQRITEKQAPQSTTSLSTPTQLPSISKARI